MQRRSAALLAAVLTTGLLSVPVAAPAGAAIADKVKLYGLTTDNKLFSFDSATPGTPTTPAALTGLDPGDELLGMDVRPATGQLYGLGKTSLYILDPETAKATRVGGGTFNPALSGTEFGVDFNPVVDRMRVVSDTGQNVRLNPDGGGVAAGDSALSFTPEDANGDKTPHVTAAAYTNSMPGVPAATSSVTELYDIDDTLDILVAQGRDGISANTGILFTVGSLGVDATDIGGFDIDPAPGVGADGKPMTANVGLAALEVGGQTGLYTIDLKTGAATLEGKIGDGTTKLKGLAVAPPNGYWLFGADGAVFNFGDADKPGELKGTTLNKPVVGAAATPSGEGYWMVASDGGVFNYGDGGFFGSTGAMTLNKPIVGMAAYPDGNGYWLVASDGGIFSFPRPGTTNRFYGSRGGQPLNKPIVGMAPYPNGKGYWLVAEDGGIFSYHDNTETDRFYGSTGNITLNKPIKGLTPYPDGLGYWFVATDGGVFSYAKNAPVFYSSLPERKITPPAGGEVVGIAVTPGGKGYWMAGADGALYVFGDARDFGNAKVPKPAKPIVAIASNF